MSGQDTGRPKRKLTRAELKAYESRRAAERQRIAARRDEVEIHVGPQLLSDDVVDTSYTMTRNDEFEVISADLKRLGMVVALLLILLVAATIFLR